MYVPLNLDWKNYCSVRLDVYIFLWKNDALRRLPSVTPDMREMLRSMSIVSDTSDNFVSADDYLQPQMDDQSPSAKQPLQNVRTSVAAWKHSPYNTINLDNLAWLCKTVCIAETETSTNILWIRNWLTLLAAYAPGRRCVCTQRAAALFCVNWCYGCHSESMTSYRKYLTPSIYAHLLE